MNPRTHLPALLLIALLIAPGALAYTPLADANGATLEPNPVIRGNVTIGTLKPACGTDVLCYYDDSDLQASLSTHGFHLNPDVAEPIQFKPQSVNCQFYGEDSTTATTKAVTSAWCGNISTQSGPGLAWLDISQWSSSTVEGNDTFTATTRNGANALHFLSYGTDPGTLDSDEYTLDFPDITTDVDKMRIIFGIEVVRLGVTDNQFFTLDVVDGNLTGRVVVGGTSGVEAGSIYRFNSTGTVFDDPLLSALVPTDGGVTGDISKLTLRVRADSAVGPTEVYVFALALQVKRFEFGTDDQGNPVYNMTYNGCDGIARSTPLGYTCLAEYAPNFGYQNVKDLKIAYEIDAGSLPAADVKVISRQLETGAYTWESNYRMTFHLPKMIDLTYAGDEAMTYTIPVAGKQHTVVKAAGVDKIKDVEKKKTGDKVTIVSAPVIGKDIEAELTVQFTDAQMRALSEVGFLGLPASNWASRAWVWLAGLAGIGSAFAWGLRRNRA